MKREGGGSRKVALVQDSDEEDDTDLAEDVYAFVRRTPKPWTTARIMQVAILEFRNVDRDILRATVTAALVGMKKTAQYILMASIRNGTPPRGGRAASINLETNVIDTFIN